MDTNNREATITTSDLVLLTDRTCFSNATKYLVRRMPELKEEVVADFVFSAEQLQSHVFLEAIWSQHMPAARVMTEQVASTLALDHNRHISSGVLSGQAMVAPTKGVAATGLVTTPMISHFCHGHQIRPPDYQLFMGPPVTTAELLMSTSPEKLCLMSTTTVSGSLTSSQVDLCLVFSDKRTDTGFPRLLMVKTVTTLYRGMREVIRSVRVVVAVEKNGLRLYFDAYCVDMGAVSFVTCVERFCPEILSGSLRQF